MKKISLKAILIAVVITFITSAIWYAALGNVYFELRGIDPANAPAMMPLDIVIVLVRHLITAFVLSYLIAQLNVTRIKNAIGLGVLLWAGFVLVLLIGSVASDKAPIGLAVIHGGDWLVKLVLMSVILTKWRKK